MITDEYADRNVHDGTSVRRSRVDPEDYVPLVELAWVRGSQRGISDTDDSVILDGYVRFAGRKVYRFYWHNLGVGELFERLQLFEVDLPQEWYDDSSGESIVDSIFDEHHPALGFIPHTAAQMAFETQCACFRNDLIAGWEGNMSRHWSESIVWTSESFEDMLERMWL